MFCAQVDLPAAQDHPSFAASCYSAAGRGVVVLGACGTRSYVDAFSLRKAPCSARQLALLNKLVMEYDPNEEALLLIKDRLSTTIILIPLRLKAQHPLLLPYNDA
jgi:hypothetical protein